MMGNKKLKYLPQTLFSPVSFILLLVTANYRICPLYSFKIIQCNRHDVMLLQHSPVVFCDTYV